MLARCSLALAPLAPLAHAEGPDLVAVDRRAMRDDLAAVRAGLAALDKQTAIAPSLEAIKEHLRTLDDRLARAAAPESGQMLLVVEPGAQSGLLLGAPQLTLIALRRGERILAPPEMASLEQAVTRRTSMTRWKCCAQGSRAPTSSPTRSSRSSANSSRPRTGSSSPSCSCDPPRARADAPRGGRRARSAGRGRRNTLLGEPETEEYRLVGGKSSNHSGSGCKRVGSGCRLRRVAAHDGGRRGRWVPTHRR